ncbi:DUF5060 domain-containing protein [Bacteroidota bacterium]
MYKFLTLLCLNLVLFQFHGFAQRRGLVDDFEDGTFEIKLRSRGSDRSYTCWDTDSPGTYKLKEANGVLNVDYKKNSGIGSQDHFTYTPPRGMNVSQNPFIKISIKSATKATLSLRPVYSLTPPTYEHIDQEIPGDNTWHSYTFDLYRHLYTKYSIRAVEFYIDYGSPESVSGNIEIDNLRIGGPIQITHLTSENTEGDAIRLKWESTIPKIIGSYQIYRSAEPHFKANEANFIAESSLPNYLDNGLSENAVYYYRIIPVDTDGHSFYPSHEIRQETYIKGAQPSVKVISVNKSTVKKYEKFELNLDLESVNIHNPYDPEDIDIRAWFKSPGGDTTWINGFYDDYMEVNQWKLRFSPNLVGKWEYCISVRDAAGIGYSPKASFAVVDSEHHGWIKPSVKNPHYFMHDDGTSYYAVGVYSPWRNDENRLKTFAEYNANLFAIWDIGYGGFVNSTGIIEEELGKYNQMKLGRIDSLLTILESSDIQLMYAIWPHDLFSETVWAAEWDKNPYNQLIDVVDVYADPLVWEYQKRKYRYMIARFAHSRSLGIWELINEMNGTDGWAEARHQEAYDWVEKVDRYFEKNDPYNHPVTASFSGGFDQYREPLYERNDVPNLHMYPAQGWIPKYPEDSLRSSMYNYAWASRRFWDNFDKPAIFGEAGADLAYYNRRDPEYHIAYHNAIWASFSNGLAGIPIWWSFQHLSEQDWKHLNHLRDFVSEIDLANIPFDQSIVKAEGCDAYGLSSGTSAFGWVRSYSKNDISKTSVSLKGIENGSYDITWFNTWSGSNIIFEKATVKDGMIICTVPKLNDPHPDIAFRITNSDNRNTKHYDRF